MVKIINCTPHTLNLPGMEIAPSGILPRVAEVKTAVGEVNGIPVVSKAFGSIQDLPPQKYGNILVVSALAAQAAWALGRSDVMCPGDPIRDEAGKIIGCAALCCMPKQ